MNDTYVHYNNMYYAIPTGAIVMKSSTGAFLGYQTQAGETVSITGMNALTQEQYNQIGVNAGKVGVVAGQTGVVAGQTGLLSGNIGV